MYVCIHVCVYVQMVEVLLRLGLSPLKKNVLNQTTLDCVGVRLLSTLKSQERGEEEEGICVCVYVYVIHIYVYNIFMCVYI